MTKPAAASPSHPHTCECGQLACPPRYIKQRDTDEPLGQYARQRVCPACKRNWLTLELRASDVAELRRLAYLGHLASARARAPDPLGEALNSGNGSYRP